LSGSSPPEPRLDDRSVRALRDPKPDVDVWRPIGTLDEEERRLDGSSQRCRTVFLAGAECPFSCVFCDLWRFTTDAPTPRGAIPRQLETALEDLPAGTDCLKLYNASNFFEPRAVPAGDLPRIAELASGFGRVVVECHPRWVDRRCLEFSTRLEGRLELAIGLETTHPEATAKINKHMSTTDFRRACELAADHDLGLRAFVLVGAPFVPPSEDTRWVGETVEHALANGVEHVTLIPVRAGNGALEALAEAGRFTPPTLASAEAAYAASLELAADRAVVTLDLWDIELLAAKPCCRAARVERLRALNERGRPQPRVRCPNCEGGHV